ncbi:MAG: PQQ-dependent sugar dehydrogenase [Hyphomicrobiaceae bacterium]
MVLSIAPEIGRQRISDHYGGDLAFGPDGYLYISTGDRGLADVVQDVSSPLGKLLRIDVSGDIAYTVQPNNPFVGKKGARQEIWAYGLRNPWRISFDLETGDLFIGNAMHEGTVCVRPDLGCHQSFNRPVYGYAHFGHREEDAVIGGYLRSPITKHRRT